MMGIYWIGCIISCFICIMYILNSEHDEFNNGRIAITIFLWPIFWPAFFLAVFLAIAKGKK